MWRNYLVNHIQDNFQIYLIYYGYIIHICPSGAHQPQRVCMNYDRYHFRHYPVYPALSGIILHFSTPVIRTYFFAFVCTNGKGSLRKLTIEKEWGFTSSPLLGLGMKNGIKTSRSIIIIGCVFLVRRV